MPSPTKVTKQHYETLAAWRQALRRFLRFSHAEAQGAGLPPQQHQALLAIKGTPGRDFATVRDLAERLQVKHHSAVGLVDRLGDRQLVRRDKSPADKRQIEVRLTARGEALLARLSAAHLRELRGLRRELRALLKTLE